MRTFGSVHRYWASCNAGGAAPLLAVVQFLPVLLRVAGSDGAVPGAVLPPSGVRPGADWRTGGDSHADALYRAEYLGLVGRLQWPAPGDRAFRRGLHPTRVFADLLRQKLWLAGLGHG